MKNTTKIKGKKMRRIQARNGLIGSQAEEGLLTGQGNRQEETGWRGQPKMSSRQKPRKLPHTPFSSQTEDPFKVLSKKSWRKALGRHLGEGYGSVLLDFS